MRKSARKTVHPKKKKLRKSRFFLFASVSGIVFVFLAIFILIPLFDHSTASNGRTLREIVRHQFKQVCGTITPGVRSARCKAHVIANDSLIPQAYATPPATALGPAQFHIAYNLPCTPGGQTQVQCATPLTFGPTVAIVDAFNTPSIESDLNTFNTNYGLPLCTKANGCLQIVDENGGANFPTTVDQSWSLEASMDVQTVHAICQTCKILLVETTTNSYSDLATGVNTAAQLGAVAISNSYGGPEFTSEAAYDGFYNHPGIAVVASSGDGGYGADYPAASPYVVSAGGTTLQVYSDNTYANETTWSKTGSGCSQIEQAITSQLGLANWSQTGCGTKRAISDVSADADPNTGIAVYDSTPYSGQIGWWQVGGTSLSSPIIASVFALANVTTPQEIPNLLYKNFAPVNYHDVTSGSNGNCGTIMCNGVQGYDGPTGLGSFNGLGGFTGINVPTPTGLPTPTATPSPTLTPTATPTPGSVYSITGNVYLDKNKDGIRDKGDSVFANQSVYLVPAVSPKQTTDANGNYSFKNIPAGTYTVNVFLNTGYTATTPNPVTITVGPSQIVNFGEYPPQKPIVSNVKISNITTTSISITYTTSAPGTTGMSFGLTKSTWMSIQGPYDSQLVTAHTITLTGLTKKTTYYAKVYSQEGPYLEYSPLLTFTTPAQ